MVLPNELAQNNKYSPINDLFSSGWKKCVYRQRFSVLFLSFSFIAAPTVEAAQKKPAAVKVRSRKKQ